MAIEPWTKASWNQLCGHFMNSGKGLVYESLRVVPHSWACQTSLELRNKKTDNAYKEKVSKTVIAKFELINKPDFCHLYQHRKCKMLAWTTTCDSGSKFSTSDKRKS